MAAQLRLAITADLHWGVRARGDEATRLLVSFLESQQPDVLVLAGDIGAGKDFAPCLELFSGLTCAKALIPGNHDIWVESEDPRGNSWDLYDRVLPDLAQNYGFHYLDKSPMILEDAGLALVGSINWYDYSWSIDELRTREPDWERRLAEKRFSRGRHNDGRFVRWHYTDESFTQLVTTKLTQHLELALDSAPRAIVFTHHPAFRGLNFERKEEPASIDGLLWEAFSGNGSVEQLLKQHSARVPFIFSGHTHRERRNHLDSSKGFNIGGDYHFKRMLLLDWPGGEVGVHLFGNPSLV